MPLPSFSLPESKSGFSLSLLPRGHVIAFERGNLARIANGSVSLELPACASLQGVCVGVCIANKVAVFVIKVVGDLNIVFIPIGCVGNRAGDGCAIGIFVQFLVRNSEIGLLVV